MGVPSPQLADADAALLRGCYDCLLQARALDRRATAGGAASNNDVARARALADLAAEDPDLLERVAGLRSALDRIARLKR